MRTSRLLFAALALLCAFPVRAQAQAETVVYLVRHGETQADGTRDPALSEAGRERAALLSRMLGDAGVTRLYSTDLRRTQQTAAPLAERFALEVESYDYRDLAEFAERLKSTPGRHVVSGHSNTTPELVALLGGHPGDPIAETEHDRIYVLTISEGAVTTVLLRYGAPRP